jgi:hypothetical protein
MKQHTTKTFTATIYCGFRPGYGNMVQFTEDCMEQAEKICQTYCDKNSYGLTIEPTRFIYKNGWEDGVKVGLINYPRFPRKPIEIKNIALEIASELKSHFRQERVSIVFTDETIMLGEK